MKTCLKKEPYNIKLLTFRQLSRDTQQLLKYYKKFLDLFNYNIETKCPDKWLYTSLYGDNLMQTFEEDYKTDLHENIHIYVKEPMKYFASSNIIQITPYNNETKLMGCCGNGHQQFDEGGYPFNTKNDKEEYRCQHIHDGYYTIDRTIGMVPACIADFTTGKYPFIPDNQIEEFVIEGGCFELTQTFRDETLRILKNNGIVIRCDGVIIIKKQSDELIFPIGLNIFCD